jgi:hypothetical protein
VFPAVSVTPLVVLPRVLVTPPRMPPPVGEDVRRWGDSDRVFESGCGSKEICGTEGGQERVMERCGRKGCRDLIEQSGSAGTGRQKRSVTVALKPTGSEIHELVTGQRNDGERTAFFVRHVYEFIV